MPCRACRHARLSPPRKLLSDGYDSPGESGKPVCFITLGFAPEIEFIAARMQAMRDRAGGPVIASPRSLNPAQVS